LLANSHTHTERDSQDPGSIYQPIREDLAEVKNRLKAASEVGFTRLSEMLDHSLRGGGKLIRPALVLLSGKFYDYNLERLLPMATAAELFHIATLVHDDAVDNSAVRHWRPTINEIWGADKAVLLGDYLFAKAAELAYVTRNLRAVES